MEFAKVEGFALFTKKVLVTPLRKQTLCKVIESAKSKSAASGGKTGNGKSKPKAMGAATAMSNAWDEFSAFMDT